MGELFNYGTIFFFITGELLMDSPPIPQGLGRRPKRDLPKAKNALAKGQSPPQELEVSPRSGLLLLVCIMFGFVCSKQNLLRFKYFKG